MIRILDNCFSPISFNRLPTPGVCTSTPIKNSTGKFSAIVAVVSAVVVQIMVHATTAIHITTISSRHSVRCLRTKATSVAIAEHSEAVQTLALTEVRLVEVRSAVAHEAVVQWAEAVADLAVADNGANI